MPSRKKSDTVALKLRMKELLRAKIERAAKNAGVSMNTEIATRLSASLEKDAVNYEIFGGEANFRYMRLLGGIIHEIELITKKPWTKDAHTKDKVRDVADSFFRQVGVEIDPDTGGGLLDVAPARRRAADSVLKVFVDSALDKRGPKARKKIRKEAKT